ncbi:transposase [Nocardia sp. NBC_00416]|uniref:transposase n=1 Tax=Nocardia sp. NBC_00416 TaxID=2975991 RepID=UPI003FA55D6B
MAVVGQGEPADRAGQKSSLCRFPGATGGGVDHRQVINAILWKLRAGAPWRNLLERFWPWKTAHERLRS